MSWRNQTDSVGRFVFQTETAVTVSEHGQSESRFPPGSLHAVPQSAGTDFPHVLAGDGERTFQDGRRVEVAVEATPSSDGDSLAKVLPTRLGAAALSCWESRSEATQCDCAAATDKLKAVFGQTVYCSVPAALACLLTLFQVLLLADW